MATALAITSVVPRRVIAPQLAIGVGKLQAPSSYTTGGDTIDASGMGFTGLYGALFGASGAVADSAYIFNLVGTYDSTNLRYSPSACTMAGHWSNSSAAALAEITNATDISAVNDMLVTLFGE